MTEDQINTLALCVLIPAGAVTLVLMLMVAVDRPRSVVRRRRERQRAALDQEVQTLDSRAPTLDWMRFKEVPKGELLDAAGRRGWFYRDEEIRGNSWVLRFMADRAGRPVSPSNVRQRLRGELGAADPGVDGTYRLDVARYPDVPRPEILRIAQECGWQEVRTVPDGIVLRPASARAVEVPGTFLQGPSLAELRKNPQVVHRASVLESRLGLDPLSDVAADHARGRHNHYNRLIQRNALLGLLYATVAVVGLIVTFGVLDPGGGGSWYGTLGVAVMMAALFGLSMVKVRIFARQRRRETGDFVDAYQQLRQVHEGTPSTGTARGDAFR